MDERNNHEKKKCGFNKKWYEVGVKNIHDHTAKAEFSISFHH